MNIKKWKKPTIKKGVPNKYGWVVSHPKFFILGMYTDIGFGTYIQSEYHVEIRDKVQIGSNCSIYSKNTINNTHGKIIIEEKAKIGSHTVILPKKNGEPLIIGKNSVVGAHSLVKDHIEPNSLYYGVPAKKQSKGDLHEPGL